MLLLEDHLERVLVRDRAGDREPDVAQARRPRGAAARARRAGTRGRARDGPGTRRRSPPRSPRSRAGRDRRGRTRRRRCRRSSRACQVPSASRTRAPRPPRRRDRRQEQRATAQPRRRVGTARAYASRGECARTPPAPRLPGAQRGRRGRRASRRAGRAGSGGVAAWRTAYRPPRGRALRAVSRGRVAGLPLCLAASADGPCPDRRSSPVAPPTRPSRSRRHPARRSRNSRELARNWRERKSARTEEPIAESRACAAGPRADAARRSRPSPPTCGRARAAHPGSPAIPGATWSSRPTTCTAGRGSTAARARSGARVLRDLRARRRRARAPGGDAAVRERRSR